MEAIHTQTTQALVEGTPQQAAATARQPLQVEAYASALSQGARALSASGHAAAMAAATTTTTSTTTSSTTTATAAVAAVSRRRSVAQLEPLITDERTSGYRRKRPAIGVEMGSHLLTKQFWLFPCEGRIAQ